MPVSSKQKPTKAVRVVRSKAPLKVLLLVAGRSTRFWPLQEKTLWPFLGKPLLLHQVERLREAGLHDVTFVGGAHNLELVRKEFPDVPLIEQEDLMLGMRGAMLSALPKMGDSPVLIVSSNDLIEADGYAALLEASHQGGVDGAVLAQRVKRYFPGGYLMVKGGKVVSIVEKPGMGKEPSDLVNIVAHAHNRPQKLLQRLRETASTRDDAYEVALDSLFSELTYLAVPYEGEWHAMKYPWHVLPIMERFLKTVRKQEIHGSCEISKHASIEGPVVLGPSVKVLANAMVQGPSIVGRGTVIGNNAFVRQSVVGENCVVGFGTEVARSYVGSGVTTHMAFIGDSVIADSVSFGAGSVTANMRLDKGEVPSVVKGEKVATGLQKFGAIVGRGVRIGVNVTLAPGVKVGEGTFICSATYVDRDVPDNSFVKMGVTGLDVRENRIRQ
jgi:bifunctional UDP-N-acetylglucosamine pyrophosphorylase/glucosamine-1-phosphate N-acetyltransferase